MTIETFTKEQFENALPHHKRGGQPLCREINFGSSEHVYLLQIDETTGIEIRSSISPKTGKSTGSGEDSIRAWLVEFTEIDTITGRKLVSKPLGTKVNRWTTRLPGWEGRLEDVLRTLYGWRKTAGNCPKCGKPKKIGKVKKENANKGRVFAKCFDCDTGFIWLTEVK